MRMRISPRLPAAAAVTTRRWCSSSSSPPPPPPHGRVPLLSSTAAAAAAASAAATAAALLSALTAEVARTESGGGGGEIFGASDYAANDPIEDRCRVARLDVLGAWWFSVFDGHSGWQTAEFVHKELPNALEVELANRLGLQHEDHLDTFSTMIPGGSLTGAGGGSGSIHPTFEFEGKVHERLVSGALVSAFERTDRIYKSKVQGAFEVGFGRDTRAGSCGLGALLVDGTLFVANAGDSRAVLAVTEEGYNALPTSQRGIHTLDELAKGTSTTSSTTTPPTLPPSARRTSGGGRAAEDKEIDSAPPPTVHVTEYLRRAAMLKAQGEMLDPTVEAKLREALVREVQSQDARAATPDPQITAAAHATARRSASGSGDAANSSSTNGGGGSKFLALDLTRDHNCREKREMMKLEAEHPDELDVVMCKHPTACYIKGKLQPTRSFGDFYLKYSEFMRSPLQHASAGRYISPPYTPPYITATPEVTVTKLRPGVDDFLVMGTDGLWDFMTSQEAIDLVGRVLRKNGGTPKTAADALKTEVLQRAAAKAGMTLAELQALPPGRERRRRHDDVTIVVVDLKKAFEFFWWG